MPQQVALGVAGAITMTPFDQLLNGRQSGDQLSPGSGLKQLLVRSFSQPWARRHRVRQRHN
jgi:hypothetical protein